MIKLFLEEVVSSVKKEVASDISDIIFIVPSKRAGLFLKKELIMCYHDQTLFLPKIVSIEEFVVEVSGLQQIDNIQALFEFYQAYLETYPHVEKENFETFNIWAQTLIYDFNEIDRYCIDHSSFFSYLSNIQDLNHWYLQKEKTELVENYINFWNSLSEYYVQFKKRLLEKKVGYQGLLYRQASENINDYIKQVDKQHVFVGFNALNNAEQLMFQALLKAGLAKVYWDADQFFIENDYHDASLFLRRYKKDWGHYKDKPFQWIQDHFSKEKDIKIIGVPKNIGQAKIAGNIISKIPVENIENTALVLADETLLQPVLGSLPGNIGSLNITMGLPLKEVPLSSLFDVLFTFHKNDHSKGMYYKSILEIVNNPSIYRLLESYAANLTSLLSSENLVFVSMEKLCSLATKEQQEILRLLFLPWKSSEEAISKSTTLLKKLKNVLDKEEDALELEHVYHFYTVFNKLAELDATYEYISTISSLHQLYKDILSLETLDFRGEPFSGLQLMGMLESRCLDFETVIITSVNEGVLPAGKSTNSFIPYDLKKAYNLPTYKEKDAIYTYHFYRLIQRAKNVYLLYNTEDQGVGGGEMSRFLLQLDIDKRPAHTIKKYIVASEVPKLHKESLQIPKNEALIHKIKELAEYGLSPSALTSYIRNPIDFYYSYILGVRDVEQVEETIAANTLGTVIHNTLENFYKPLEQRLLTLEHLEQMKARIDDEVSDQFRQVYTKLDITQGKNLLIFEVAKKYIYNFLASEMRLLSSGAELQILSIESNLKVSIEIPELDFPVHLKGKVDRIDRLDGQIRIIDYKSGKVTRSDMVLMDWGEMMEDYKYSKIVQVLAYAYMSQKENLHIEQLEAGIISFKNLKEGFLKFGTREAIRGKVNHEITQAVFDSYLEQIKKLIKEMLDPQIAFVEKEI